MISSKAIDLLKTFSEEEFRKFGLYVSSPYFNKENIQVKFYGLLKKYYPEFDNRNFDKEKIFSKLYPDKKYNDGVMRNILSGTLELAGNFLAAENILNNGFNFNLSLMRELSLRKMEKHFEKAEKETKNILNCRTIMDEHYFYDNYLLTNEIRMDSARQKSMLYGTERLLPEMSNNLTIFYIINILKTGTYMANSNQMMLKFDHNLNIINDLEIYLEREAEKYKDITYIKYYYNAFKLAKTEDEKYFYSLIEIVNNDYEKLSIIEKGDIFIILTNYCYYKINKGELKFRKDHFLINKENIERGYYTAESPFLTHIRYQNVIITGIDAGEISWVETFMEKYKKELDKFNRENCYNFCRSLVYYHKKQYGDALDWAAKVKTDDLSYKHQLKSLYLKIYFDMNDTEPFYSHVDSYRHFIMNEKHIPAITRNVIGSYINFTKKLFDIKNRTAERDFDLIKIRREISESKAMINKPWLVERIDKIERQ
jgi:hypothetical protein